MMPSEKKIARENALDIIKQFAKEYRRELGTAAGEIIFVGGGSIMPLPYPNGWGIFYFLRRFL